MKKKPFAFRISDSDRKLIVVDGVKELLSELKAIGRNLNQLTTLANMDRIDTVYLTETKAQLNEIYEKISSIFDVEQ